MTLKLTKSAAELRKEALQKRKATRGELWQSLRQRSELERFAIIERHLELRFVAGNEGCIDTDYLESLDDMTEETLSRIVERLDSKITDVWFESGFDVAESEEAHKNRDYDPQVAMYDVHIATSKT